MTESTIKSPRDAAGLALYLEFRKEGYTYQLIATQPIVTLDGKPSRARTMRRRMNAWQSRKNWHFDIIGIRPSLDVDGKINQLEDETAKTLAAQGLSTIIPLLNQMFHQEYSLYQKPIMVEFSYEEFGQIKQGKTPAGLIRRIQRTRVAQGFSEELVPATATPTV